MSNKLLLNDTELALLKRNSPNFSDRGQDLADKLDSLQQGKVKTIAAAVEGINQLIAFSFDVTTGAASGLEIFKANAPFKFEVVDVIVQPRGTSTNGTIKITNGTNDITDAMVCAADKTMVRAASVDNTYSTIDENETLEIVCAGDSVGSTIALVTVLAIAKD